MRRNSFICQSFSLTHTKPVLFIRNHKSQTVILHIFLNQRMSADDNLSAAALDIRFRQTLFFCCHGTREQNRNERNLMLFQYLFYRFKMLSGKHFRRHHQRSLAAVAAGHNQCQHSKNSLTGTNISLYQPTHDLTTSHIRYNFLPDALLCTGQFIGKSFYQT